MTRPMLGDIELEHVQKIEVDGDQVLVQHGVPALEGDFFQGLGRRATQISLAGVLTGPEAGEGLNTLRDKFRAAEPVSFVADITTATRVDQVLIEEMGVRELAGKPERFEYAFTLREFIPPPEPEEEPPEIEEPENPAENIDQGVGILIVEVSVEDHPTFDFSKVTLTVRGTQEDGTELLRTLSNRTDNTWTEEEFPAGQYTVEAVASASASITGSVPAEVRPSETTRVTITLRTGATIAKAFVIHFRFDKAFIEPCMRAVMRQVAQYAEDHPSEKLLIVGHTDKVDTEDYNQSLSERRARSVHAFLTVGRDRDAALAEWHALRQERTRRQIPEIKDDWGVCEYQHMLQDLGFYPGPVDGDHGSLTDDAVRAYRCQKGLPPGTNVDNAVWQHLIEDYLTQDSLAVPANRFLPNAGAGCDGGVLKWLGCGENSPLPQPRPTRRTAWRPYRRVEFLFVASNALPDGCMAPEPATFNLPQQGAVADRWCLGPGDPDNRCCFGTYTCDQARTGQWCIRRTVDEQTITVDVFVHDEDDNPVGNREFVLIAPDGQFKADETARGEPLPARTGSNGRVSFQDMPVGVYTLEVRARRRRDYVLIRLAEGSYDDAKGNVVCKRLTPDDTVLEVVVIDAPVLREIKLPVVARLMTALHPTTREIRTCPAFGGGAPVPQATTRTEEEVRTAFDGVNQVWRQARVRFELTDTNIVREAYEFRTACEVDDNEFITVLQRCSYPNTVNVFFFADLAGTGEAGIGISMEGGAPLGISGCAVGDRFQFTILGIPTDRRLDEAQTIQVLAHELGHFLNLDHTDETSVNADRLMFPHGAFDGSNRTLIDSEVNQARASRGAALECSPITLRVTDATQIGGTLSHEFIVIQNNTGVVTVEAIANESGVVTMAGGTPVSDRQQTVSAATTGVTEVIATYTPAGGGEVFTNRVSIIVATFRLRVEGAGRVGGPTSTTFAVISNPTVVVTVVAEIDPAPFCVPTNLVIWTGGDAAPDPLRRNVSGAIGGETIVTATVAGESRIVVIHVIDLVYVANRPPYDDVLTEIHWDDAFRIRADIPGETRDELTVLLKSIRRTP